MLDMTTDDKTGTRMTYKISERNGLGLRNTLVSATKGTVRSIPYFWAMNQNKRKIKKKEME